MGSGMADELRCRQLVSVTHPAAPAAKAKLAKWGPACRGQAMDLACQVGTEMGSRDMPASLRSQTKSN